MRAFLRLLNILFVVHVTNCQQKTFKSINIRPSDWTVQTIKEGYKSVELCRSACVLAEDECKAFSYNETTTLCEFGDFVPDDLIKLDGNYGQRVYYDVDYPPQTCKFVIEAIVVLL